MSPTRETFKEVELTRTCGEKYKVFNIFTKKGANVFPRRRLCEVVSDAGQRVIIKAKSSGVVTQVLVNVGDFIADGCEVVEVEACGHKVHMGNICCDCGVMLKEEDLHKTEAVSMLHSVPDIKISRGEAQKLGQEDIRNLLKQRKLVLLVDLDQTLIHTTNDNIPPNLKDVYHFQLSPGGPWYHTRLRPHTEAFLEKISKFYELHICTFGVREYAHHIAHFLDPNHNLFGQRILSRNECLDLMSKKANLDSLFPCGDNLVCVIDDRTDVWSYSPNVVQVAPYHFFCHTGDINAPHGLQKKEADDHHGIDFKNLKTENIKPVCADVVDVIDSDDYLLRLENILKKIHKEFFNEFETRRTGKRSSSRGHRVPMVGERSLPDLKKIIPSVKRKVLRGVHLVFSGVVPQQVKLRESKAYLVATRFGATVTEKVVVQGEAGSPTTHLVAANVCTEKAHVARKIKSIKIVTPNWLWKCAEHWELVEEQLFPLTEETEKEVQREPPLYCLSPDAPWHKPRIIHEAGKSTRTRTPSGTFLQDINPLIYFSADDKKSMKDEVEKALNDDDDDDSESDQDTESSEENTDSEDMEEEEDETEPNRKKRKRNYRMERGEDDLRNLIFADSSDEEEGDFCDEEEEDDLRNVTSHSGDEEEEDDL